LSYERYDETQRERCYSKKTIEKTLSECGFEIIAVAADFDMSEPEEDCERWYYICRKNS